MLRETLSPRSNSWPFIFAPLRPCSCEGVLRPHCENRQLFRVSPGLRNYGRTLEPRGDTWPFQSVPPLFAFVARKPETYGSSWPFELGPPRPFESQALRVGALRVVRERLDSVSKTGPFI